MSKLTYEPSEEMVKRDLDSICQGLDLISVMVGVVRFRGIPIKQFNERQLRTILYMMAEERNYNGQIYRESL